MSAACKWYNVEVGIFTVGQKWVETVFVARMFQHHPPGTANKGKRGSEKDKLFTNNILSVKYNFFRHHLLLINYSGMYSFIRGAAFRDRLVLKHKLRQENEEDWKY